MSDRSLALAGAGLSLAASAAQVLFPQQHGFWLLVFLAGICLLSWALVRELRRPMLNWRLRDPIMSTLIVAFVGALVFAGIWWAIPRLFKQADTQLSQVPLQAAQTTTVATSPPTQVPPTQAPAATSPKNPPTAPAVVAKVESHPSPKKVVPQPRLPVQATQPTPAALDGVSMVPLLPKSESGSPLQFEIQSKEEIRDVDVLIGINMLIDKSNNEEYNIADTPAQYIERIGPDKRPVISFLRTIRSTSGIKFARTNTYLEFTVPGVVGRWFVSQGFSYTEDKQGRRRWDLTTVNRGSRTKAP